MRGRELPGAPARFSDPLIDVKKVIAWVREHGRESGADPNAVFLAGSSAGGHLASLAALTSASPAGPDTSVAGVVSLYGYYGRSSGAAHHPRDWPYATTNAPPCFVVHGEQDTVVVEDARGFVEQLRATSSNPVVYAELPGAQHGFDLFRSRRFDTVVDAIEAFAAHVRSRRFAPPTQHAARAPACSRARTPNDLAEVPRLGAALSDWP